MTLVSAAEDHGNDSSQTVAVQHSTLQGRFPGVAKILAVLPLQHNPATPVYSPLCQYTAARAVVGMVAVGAGDEGCVLTCLSTTGQIPDADLETWRAIEEVRAMFLCRRSLGCM